MFDTNLGFLENKHYKNECGKKIKKLKTDQKYIYKLELAPQALNNFNPCPFELQPTKLNNNILQDCNTKPTNKLKKSKKKRKRNERSTSEPQEHKANQTDIHDTILTGLQTVIDLCALLEECDGKYKLKHNKKKDKSNELDGKRLLDIPCQLGYLPSSSQGSTSLDDPSNSKVSNPSSTSINFRKIFSRMSLSKLKSKCTSRSSISATLEQNETKTESSIEPSYNQSFQVLRSSTKKSKLPKDKVAKQKKNAKDGASPVGSSRKQTSSGNNTGFVSDMKPIEEESQSESRYEGDDKHHRRQKKNRLTRAGQHRNSSLESIISEKQASKAGSTVGLVNVSCTEPVSRAFQPNPCIPSNCPTLNSEDGWNPTDQSPSDLCDGQTCFKRDVCLSTKCFPPMEIGPITPDEPKPRHTSVYDPSTLCNPDYTQPICKSQIDCKKTRRGIPLVQPVVGFCDSGKCGAGEHLKGIKYALVKISEFMGFNTYEIMKPYKDKPKNIPTCIAEIFVTSRQKKDVYTVTEDTARISFQVPDSSRRSVTGLRTLASRDASDASSMHLKELPPSTSISQQKLDQTVFTKTSLYQPQCCRRCVCSTCSPNIGQSSCGVPPAAETQSMQVLSEENVPSRETSAQLGRERHSIMSTRSSSRSKSAKKITYGTLSREPSEESMRPIIEEKSGQRLSNVDIVDRRPSTSRTEVLEATLPIEDKKSSQKKCCKLSRSKKSKTPPPSEVMKTPSYYGIESIERPPNRLIASNPQENVGSSPDESKKHDQPSLNKNQQNLYHCVYLSK